MEIMYKLLADLVALVHAAFIVFVVGGELLIVIGLFRRWRWVRHLPFRIVHLVCIGYVVAEAWLGVNCPLTVWEEQLRVAAKQQGYPRGFIGYWVHQLFFFDAPPWVFTLAYSLFGAAVAATFIWGAPRRSRSAREETSGENARR